MRLIKEIFFTLMMLAGVALEGSTQMLRNTNQINPCLTEYTFGTDTEDKFAIVIVSCNETPAGTSWQPPLGLIDLTEMLIVGGGIGYEPIQLGNPGILYITDRYSMRFDYGNKANPSLSPVIEFKIGNGGIENISGPTSGAEGINTTVVTSNTGFINRTAIGGGSGTTSNVSGNSETNSSYAEQRQGNFESFSEGPEDSWLHQGNPSPSGDDNSPGHENIEREFICNFNQVNEESSSEWVDLTNGEIKGNSSVGKGCAGIVIFRFDFSNILPVEYVYTEARYLRQSRSSLISWVTAKEHESSHFEIERAIQGVNFEKIGEVKALGKLGTTISYQFEDKHLPFSTGTILYILKYVDIDGTHVYSKVMSIRTP